MIFAPDLLPSDRPIVVFGAGGQVGGALLKILGARAHALNSSDADFRDPGGVRALLEGLKASPAAVINAAAYTQVDRAENEEDLARTVNADTVGAIARFCAAHSIPFVHYSTDYVFPGTGTKPWVEADETSPLSAYGRTKLLGEKQVQEANPPHLIFRTSWVFDPWGKNFVKTMIRLGAEKEELRVVNDQWGAPTYAPHLARATLQALQALVKNPGPETRGIYHLCNAGESSWHEFATEILRLAREKGLPVRAARVVPISTEEFPTPARRPLNSRLDCSKAARILGVQLPHWREGLKECMEAIAHEIHPA